MKIVLVFLLCSGIYAVSGHQLEKIKDCKDNDCQKPPPGYKHGGICFNKDCYKCKDGVDLPPGLCGDKDKDKRRCCIPFIKTCDVFGGKCLEKAKNRQCKFWSKTDCEGDGVECCYQNKCTGDVAGDLKGICKLRNEECKKGFVEDKCPGSKWIACCPLD